MDDVPETRYTRTTEGAYLAYQVLGEGPIDLLYTLYGAVPIDLQWDEPEVNAWLHRLASFSRLIVFDARGFGCSDRFDPRTVPALQIWMDDIATVMNAVGSEKAALFSARESALAAMLFAATFPHRVEGLVLGDAYARFLRNDECPWGLPPHLVADYAAVIEDIWGTGEILGRARALSNQAKRRLARAERLTASPRAVAAFTKAFMETDVTHVLSAIQAPTLVVASRGDPHVRVEHARYLASHIRGAKLVELTEAGSPLLTPEALNEVQALLTGVRPSPVLDRVLTTVMFTDIVGSTETAARVGDQRWTESLNRYDAMVQQQLERFRGHQVNTTGDGTLATFDGPARAIECARVIAQEVSPLGFEIRAGVHTGEIETRGADVAGVAVHIAARVANLAGPSEVLVSRTVTDLVAGSGIEFEDRGEHELKGVPDTWKLFAVKG